MTTLFISDLHLTAERPEIARLFVTFLAGRARRAEALYILGDLFEYWIGDEMVALPQVAPLVAALRALTAGGVPVYVMHGNRDFLLGAGFEQATGCRILPEPSIIDLYGRPTLLLHGDTLCTDDVDYQRFRMMVRDPQWVQMFLGKSLAERETIVRNLRETSKAAMATKTAEIMDVNAGAVTDTLRSQGVDRLIHGHTHRPATHKLQIDGRAAERIVLGDWYEQGSVLECTAEGCRLEALH